tara:strand:+ start:731 stop:1153 length:423 start_codon:yes stop_codon:yes gene_type:complete
MSKTITKIFFILLLNGCIQNTAFLGPIITGASTGSIHQAAVTYSSNKVVTQITGKTPVENLKKFFMTSKEIDNENAALSYRLAQVTTQITEKTSTEKTSTENLKKILTISKKIDSENANNFFNSIKKMNENSSIKNLSNQ